jgi:hypothetical protein
MASCSGLFLREQTGYWYPGDTLETVITWMVMQDVKR